jgi:glycosyltransferase involved in cell wall biosynthesis
VPRPPEGRLARRLYEPYLTHVPFSYAVLRAGSYEVAHAVHPPDALAAARYRRRTGAVAVLSYLGIPDHAGLMERRRRLELTLAALRGCDTVVALSRYAADAFRHWLGYEAPVIAPGVDLDVFRPGQVRADCPTIVCSAAAEEPRKHVGLLVAALALVRRERPEARLVLSRPRDLVAARRAGVDLEAAGVELADLDGRDALARAYQEAWVTALPATNEAFGLVLAESLACGTPAVGYDDGAIPELLDRPGIGGRFDRLTPAALASALLAALELSGRPETAGRCRERAEEFSTDRCTAAYLELYRALGAC